MSFIIIRTYGGEWKRDVNNDWKPKEWVFESDKEIDREFMNLVESEFSEEEQFLHHLEVVKYLDIFGIYEKSPYIYSAEEWLIGPLFKDEAPIRERFVWAFPSLLKLGCIAVKYPKAKIVLVNQRAENDPGKIHKIDFFAGGKDYLGPIVEYRDIYMYISSYVYSHQFGGIISNWFAGKVKISPLGKKRKIDIRLIDKKRNIDVSDINLQGYLQNLEKSNWITRELDAQFFDPEKAEVYPYRQYRNILRQKDIFHPAKRCWKN